MKISKDLFFSSLLLRFSFGCNLIKSMDIRQSIRLAAQLKCLNGQIPKSPPITPLIHSYRLSEYTRGKHCVYVILLSQENKALPYNQSKQCVKLKTTFLLLFYRFLIVTTLIL